jgi:hypothetical protein
MDAARNWVADHQRTGRNVYFQPNETRADCSKKPGKGDMVASLCRFADVDPDDAHFPLADERGRLSRLATFLAASEHPPTVIIDSGSGLQPIWAVAREALTPEVTARIEAETAGLERALGGGGTHNIDRLLRLPGTVNFPNKVKRDKGRGITRARLIFAGSSLYRPDQVGGLVNGHLVEAGLVRPRSPSDSTPGHTADPPEVAALIKQLEQAQGGGVGKVEDLTDELQARLAAAMTLDPETMTDHDYARRRRLADRWAGLVDDLTAAGRDDSHSGVDMSLAAMLQGAGFNHLETALALLAFKHGKANNEEWPAEALRLRHVARSVLRSHTPAPVGQHGTDRDDNGIDAGQHGEPPDEAGYDASHEADAQERAEERDDEDPDASALPDLLVLKSDLPLVAQRLRDKLARHAWLFERGGPARLTCYPPAENRPAEIHPLGVDGTTNAAHEVCRPYQSDARGKRRDVTLPERVAKLYLALNGRWGLRPLHGICSSVLLADDGSIHAHEGYHARSGMWCTQPPPLDVPDRPANDQAVDALYRLRSAIRTFTFKGSPLTRIDGIAADVVDIEQRPGLCESAALCGLLTGVCRASLPLAPGVMINAPSVSGSGAGKGLLARMIVAIAFGIIAKAGTAGHDEQELEKRVGAALLRGEPVILLDNLNNTLLRSAQLESCLTEPLVSVRLFGVLKMQDVRCTAFVVLTGNGLQTSGDSARRFVYPTLEPPLDNPEQRQYPPGFLDGILGRRSELLSDCLTIWRWGRQQSGLKRGLPFGSYERWGTWVRDPLLALGCADPVRGVEDARDRDPNRVNLSALFAEWRVWHGTDWVKADDLNYHVRRLIDDKERVPAIRQKLSHLANTRLDGFMLESRVEGNAATRVTLYRVVGATP